MEDFDETEFLDGEDTELDDFDRVWTYLYSYSILSIFYSYTLMNMNN